VVDEMDGVAVVCRTRLTSLRASSDQRSTFNTYMVCSISLCVKGASEQGRAHSVGQPEHDLLAVYLLSCLLIYNHEPDAGRRGDGSAVLVAETAHSGALRLLYDNEPDRC
jgi:hypothetical protein